MTSSSHLSSAKTPWIPFVKPYLSSNADVYLKQVLVANHFHGDGNFTQKCHHFLEKYIKSPKVLLTHSCTAALEMAAILIGLEEGDEVIMPSYTFSSTANAVVLRRATPVFIDVRKDTLNIDESLIEAALTPKTKAIFPVHYAGVCANMEAINKIAEQHNLYVIEDAAQGLGSTYQGKHLGTLGHLGAYSFHGTKNIISGEGGALVINDMKFKEIAEIIREKGTNRSQFLRGEIDKYTWQDVGSSYLPNELTAGLLFSQLEEMESINHKRLEIWNTYHDELEFLEKGEFLIRPTIPSDCTHNAHIYYIIVNKPSVRDDLLAFMKERGVQCTSHYVPLHSAPAGVKYGKTSGILPITDTVAEQIVRLPLWPQMSSKEVTYIIETLISFFRL